MSNAIEMLPPSKVRKVTDEFLDRCVHMGYYGDEFVDGLTPIVVEVLSHKGKDTPIGRLASKLARSMEVDDEV